MRSKIKKLFSWVIDWLWTRPVTQKNEPKATEVVHNYELVEHRGMYITVTFREKILWDNQLTRKQKNFIWENHKRKLRKGELIMAEINGRRVAIKNKQYGINTSTDSGAKTTKQPRSNKANPKSR